MPGSNQFDFALVVDGWFDGERLHRDGPSTFVVRGGRFEEIVAGDHAQPLQRQAMPVERGAFLMPGLVDAHVHLFLDGAPTDPTERAAHLRQPAQQLADAARASARQALACGVTVVRDAGDRHGINHLVRAEAIDPASALPRVRSGGRGIKRASRYGAFMAGDVADSDDIRRAVDELARDCDEIKMILTGIIDFDAGAVTDEPQFSLEEARVAVEAARAAGRKTFAHCSGSKGLAIAARAGVGSIEHGFFMDRATLSLMADNDVAWTPTFCPVHFQWAHPEAVGWSPNTVGHLRRILDEHARHLLIADELGVRLLLGTDAGSMGVEHGRAVWDEIDRYLEAGLSLALARTAATSAARRHFGFEHALLGPGADFDALLLGRSPFDDVTALRQPLRVWRGATEQTEGLAVGASR